MFSDFLVERLAFPRSAWERGTFTPQAVQAILQQQPGLVDYCQTPRTRAELQAFCGLKDREHFRKTVLKPLLEAGWLAMTLPDKPNSPKQQYFCGKGV